MMTLAAIPMNEYLMEYERLAAMTGTAASDAPSYDAIYRLGVVVIPTNRPMIRVDHVGVFYATAADKLRALVQEAAKRHERGQPVLIGAGSIQQTEIISAKLTEKGIEHTVLTARNNEREAEVIEGSAGLGAVTVIARMAGRGIDIVLGGPDATAEERDDIANRGGLCVLGAERFINRRMEMHLRGRAGRQGDPGESELYASFEDEAVLALSANAPRNRKMLEGTGGMRSQTVTRIFDRAQAHWAVRAAEQVRKLREYDAVLARQRREIYAMREEVLAETDLSGLMMALTAALATEIIGTACHGDDAGLRQCKQDLLRLYPTGLSMSAIARLAARLAGPDDAQASGVIRADVGRAYALREAEECPPNMRTRERAARLTAIDRNWCEHLGQMDALLDGIGLRAVGGRSPLAEYRREAEELMVQMLRRVDRESAESLFTVKRNTKPAKRRKA